MSYPILLLVGAIGGAATLAWLRETPPPTALSTASRAIATSSAMVEGAGGFAEPSSPELPPNHPAIGAGASHASAASGATGGAHGSPTALPPAEDERAAVTWKVPATWQTLPNPTSIRLATYAVPGAGSDPGADVSVSRAGGGTEANVERWVRQFDDAGQEKRSVKTVRGLKIVVVEVSGTYLGSGTMMPAAGDEHATDKKNWALLGAVVETPGSSYFFKMTGPLATVKGAHKAFDALLDGVTPAS